MDANYLENPQWAGNLHGQSFDDATFLLGLNEDAAIVPLTISISAVEEMHGTLLDAAEVYVDLQPSSVDQYGHEDSAEVYLDIQPSSVDIEAYVEAATVYLLMSPLGGECYSRFHFTGEGEADPRWASALDIPRWGDEDTLPRWYCFLEVQPGCN